MGRQDDRIAKRLEAQIAEAQRRLASGDTGTPGWAGFIGGLALGTLAGGLVTLFLTSRQDDEADEALPTPDDAVLLRESDTAPRSLAALVPETGAASATDQLAAAELEEPEALSDIADHAATATTPEDEPDDALEDAPDDAPVPIEQTVITATPQAPPPPVGQAATAAPKAVATTVEQTPIAAVPPAPTGPIEQAPAAPTPKAPASPAEQTPAETTPQDAAVAAGRVEASDGTCPASHPIKGNHSSTGDYIYHLPGSRNYERTKAEACFVTEADAIAAGFRAPRG